MLGDKHLNAPEMKGAVLISLQCELYPEAVRRDIRDLTRGDQPVEAGKVFEQFLDLPDGYQAQVMVMAEPVSGFAGKVAYRSRVWLGHESEMDPYLYRAQVHWNLEEAIRACYAMLRQAAPYCFRSRAAIDAIRGVDRKLSTG